MSNSDDVIKWLLPYKRRYPKWGAYDDYHEERAGMLAAEGQWNSACLEAGAIRDEARSTAMIDEIKKIQKQSSPPEKDVTFYDVLGID